MNPERGTIHGSEAEPVRAANVQCLLKVFLVSYAPRLLGEASANIAVVIVGNGFADVRVVRDWKGVLAVDPEADIELLTELIREIQDKLRAPDQREKMLLRMEDCWSNAFRISACKGCLTEDPASEIDALASQYL